MDELIKDVVQNRLLWKAGELFRVNNCLIKPYLQELLESVKFLIESPGYEITVNDQNVAEICLARSIVAIRSSRDQRHLEEKFVEILQCCLKFPLSSVNTMIPPHAKIASDILSYFYLSYSDLPSLVGFLDTAMKFLLCGNLGIVENLTCFFHLVVENNIGEFAQHVDVILQSILHYDNFSLIPLLVHLYGADDFKRITMNLSQLLHFSTKIGSDITRESLLRLVSLVYEDEPQVVEECLRTVIDFLNYPFLVRTTINILNEIFWADKKIFYYHVTGLMQIGLAASTQDFDLIGSLLVSICSADEALAKDCLVYLTACLFHKTANVAIIFAWIESLLHNYSCHFRVMEEVISHLENENEITEFSMSVIARLKMIMDESNLPNSSCAFKIPVMEDKPELTLSKQTVKEVNVHNCNTGVEGLDHSKVEDEAIVNDSEHLVSLGAQSCDMASTDDTSPVNEHLEILKAVENSMKIVHQVIDPYEKENISRQVMKAEWSDSIAIGDENHNYLNDSKSSPATEESTNYMEVTQIKTEIGLEGTNSGSDIGISKKYIKNAVRIGSGYFENVGYQSSQTSLHDKECDKYLLAPKKSVSNEITTKLDISYAHEMTSKMKHNLCMSAASLIGPEEDKEKMPNSRTTWKDESIAAPSNQNKASRVSKEYGGASNSMTLSLLRNTNSKSTLIPDTLDLYCDVHRKEVVDSIKSLLILSPIPCDLMIFGDEKCQQKIILEFCCSSRDSKCAFGKLSAFRLETRHIKTWLHIMFLRSSVEDDLCCLDGSDALQGDHSALENDSTNLNCQLVPCCSRHHLQMEMKKKIKIAWSSVHSLEKNFNKTILSGFPPDKEIQKAVKELRKKRCFDLFSRDEGSQEWLCFVCRNRTHGPSFIKSDGSLNVDGMLKKKSGYMKFFKPWKFTRFLIDGFNLSYMRNDQPIHLDEITKVKAREHSMLLSKYTTVSLTAVKGKFSTSPDGSVGDCSKPRKKKLTLRFFDPNEAKTWIRCLYVIMAKFHNMSDNLGTYPLSE